MGKEQEDVKVQKAPKLVEEYCAPLGPCYVDREFTFDELVKIASWEDTEHTRKSTYAVKYTAYWYKKGNEEGIVIEKYSRTLVDVGHGATYTKIFFCSKNQLS